MTLNEKIEALHKLGEALRRNIYQPELEAVIRRSFQQNAWFTPDNQQKAVQAVANEFLQKDLLKDWLQKYYDNFNESTPPRRTVALVVAGNIPLVGFHDVLCVFLSGNKAKIKISEKDALLLPFLLQKLGEIAPATIPFFELNEGRLPPFDAVIATGSNNSARYFESYFSKYPNIIRKNRNSVGILGGGENEADFMAFGDDVFSYFGLGCRNVSKIYVPREYDFIPMLEALHEFSTDMVVYERYKNNFDFQVTLLILNRVKYMQNGCLLLAESDKLSSSISVLHYEYYDSIKDLEAKIAAQAEAIQCVVASASTLGNSKKMPQLPADLSAFAFGKAQSPALFDYADGVDTMQFLKEL